MKKWMAGLMAVAGMMPVSAELPGLNEKEWLGYFVGIRNRKVMFGINSEGKGTIRLFGEKDQLLAQRLTIPVEFQVLEIKPDGKIQSPAVLPNTLESTHEATKKPEDVVFHGKVKGDASFEVFVHEDRGVISLGGRLLEAGKLTKNPLRFSIEVKIPAAYTSDKSDGDKDRAAAFREETRNDRLQLTWTDGTQVKQETGKAVNAATKEVNGPGISSAEIEFSSFQGNKLEFKASENSSLAISNPQAGPLYKGFTLNWTADLVKDPEGKSRLSIRIK